MRGLLNTILIKLGLKKTLVKTYLKIRDYTYRNRKEWYMKENGISLKFNTYDDYSWLRFYGYYGTNIPEFGTTKIFFDYINKDSVVLDIGAHLGYFTCLAGALAKEVHSIEVDPKCISYIQDNINANNLNNVTVHNVALADKKGTVKIQNLETPNSSITINSRVSNSYIEVDSTSLDEFIEAHNIEPDFVKIDIEGAEGIAINGMKKLLKRDIILLLEVHNKALQKWFNKDAKDVISVLLDYGFTIKKINHRSKKLGLEDVTLDTNLGKNSMLFCKKK